MAELVDATWINTELTTYCVSSFQGNAFQDIGQKEEHIQLISVCRFESCHLHKLQPGKTGILNLIFITMKRENCQTPFAESAKGRVEQLLQLMKVTWDGDLISKSCRDELVKKGLAQRAAGYNMITEKGIINVLVPKLRWFVAKGGE